MAGERAVETWPIFVFRVTFYVHRGSGQQARVYPRRWLSLSSRAKAFTLQGRHRRFVGDSAFYTSLRGAPLLVGEQRSGITRFCKKYRIWDFYLQSMDFQREPQSKHHLYCEQEKPAHCHGSLLLRLGTHQIQNRTRGAHKISPHGTMTKRTPAVNWDHAVSWGGGLG